MSLPTPRKDIQEQRKKDKSAPCEMVFESLKSANPHGIQHQGGKSAKPGRKFFPPKDAIALAQTAGARIGQNKYRQTGPQGSLPLWPPGQWTGLACSSSQRCCFLPRGEQHQGIKGLFVGVPGSGGGGEITKQKRQRIRLAIERKKEPVLGQRRNHGKRRFSKLNKWKNRCQHGRW